MTDLLTHYGLFLLFGAVAIESAGVPVPGETTLDRRRGAREARSLHALAGDRRRRDRRDHRRQHRLLARPRRGPALLTHWNFVDRYAERTLPPAERFFEKHGAKTVFFGRFIAVLRVAAAWLAGISRMHWWEFFLWNAAGGIAWAVAISLLAYAVGQAVADAISRYGLYAVLALIPLGVAAYFAHRYMRKKLESA